MLSNWNRKHTLVLLFSILLIASGYYLFYTNILTADIDDQGLIGEVGVNDTVFLDESDVDGLLEIIQEDISMSGFTVEDYKVVDREDAMYTNQYNEYHITSEGGDVTLLLDMLHDSENIHIDSLLVLQNDGIVDIKMVLDIH